MRLTTGLSARGRMAVAGAVAGAAALVVGVAAWPSPGGDEPGHAASASADVAEVPLAFPPATTTPPTPRTTAPPAAPARSVPATEPRAARPGAGGLTAHDEDAEYDEIGSYDACDVHDFCVCPESGECVAYGDDCGCAGEVPPYDETTMAPGPLPDGRHAVMLIRANRDAGMVQLDELDVQTAADGTMTFTNPEIRIYLMYLTTGYDMTGLQGNPSSQFWATVESGIMTGMEPAF